MINFDKVVKELLINLLSPDWDLPTKGPNKSHVPFLIQLLLTKANVLTDYCLNRSAW